jgi:cold shock CspA family protein
MRIEGRLKKWNDGRGFGFIAADRDGSEVFVHISAFPPDGQRPSVGERISFEISTDQEGKKRAVRVACPDRITRTTRPSTERPTQRKRIERPGIFHRLAPLAIVTLIALLGYRFYNQQHPAAPAPILSSPAETTSKVSSVQFHCDGRQYCSQMTSCAEAEFFLKNCPNVKMDGNHDGVPCEQQWCR